MKAGEKHRTRREPSALRVPAVPVLLKVLSCPACKNDVEVWTADDEVLCGACGRVVHRRRRTNH